MELYPQTVTLIRMFYYGEILRNCTALERLTNKLKHGHGPDRSGHTGRGAWHRDWQSITADCGTARLGSVAKGKQRSCRVDISHEALSALLRFFVYTPRLHLPQFVNQRRSPGCGRIKFTARKRQGDHH